MELASGALLMNMRTAHVNASCKCRAVSRSEDGGRECTRHLSIGFAFAFLCLSPTVPVFDGTLRLPSRVCRGVQRHGASHGTTRS